MTIFLSFLLTSNSSYNTLVLLSQTPRNAPMFTSLLLNKPAAWIGMVSFNFVLNKTIANNAFGSTPLAIWMLEQISMGSEPHFMLWLLVNQCLMARWVDLYLEMPTWLLTNHLSNWQQLIDIITAHLARNPPVLRSAFFAVPQYIWYCFSMFVI